MIIASNVTQIASVASERTRTYVRVVDGRLHQRSEMVSKRVEQQYVRVVRG